MTTFQDIAKRAKRTITGVDWDLNADWEAFKSKVNNYLLDNMPLASKKWSLDGDSYYCRLNLGFSIDQTNLEVEVLWLHNEYHQPPDLEDALERIREEVVDAYTRLFQYKKGDT